MVVKCVAGIGLASKASHQRTKIRLLVSVSNNRPTLLYSIVSHAAAVLHEINEQIIMLIFHRTVFTQHYVVVVVPTTEMLHCSTKRNAKDSENKKNLRDEASNKPRNESSRYT